MKKPPFVPPSKVKQPVPTYDVINIPTTEIEPQNRRLFVIRHAPPDIKRESGILLPAQMFGKDKHEKPVPIPKFRYYVVAVAEDCNLMFLDRIQNKRRKIQRGDEIYLPFIEIADRYTIPFIIDYLHGGNELLVIDQDAVIGIMGLPAQEKPEPKDVKPELKITD